MKDSRMSIRLANNDLCTGCQACKAVCPKQAISMSANEEGFAFPVIDEDTCIMCHKCEKTCPVLNTVPPLNDLKIALTSKSKDEKIRLKSSSGGVFTHLAEYILNKGGAVVGAVFSKDFHFVKHVLIEDSNEIYRLRLSKYLQSDVGDIYHLVEKKLNEGKFVLFTGTGCQIAGLRSYLHKEYEKLLLVDVVCHGVPSQNFWSKYLDLIEKKYSGKANMINFRSKKIGWQKLGLEASFGKNVYFKELRDDAYLEIFQRNLSLRESCFYCKYKSVYGIADLSIGDLWGAAEIVPEFNDDKGISFILINSEKGLNTIRAIKEKIVTRKIDLNDAINHNRNIAHVSKMPENRKQFFEDLKTKPLESVLKKYTEISNKEKVKRMLDKMGVLHSLKRLLHRDKATTVDKNLEYGLLIVFET